MVQDCSAVTTVTGSNVLPPLPADCCRCCHLNSGIGQLGNGCWATTSNLRSWISLDYYVLYINNLIFFGKGKTLTNLMSFWIKVIKKQHILCIHWPLGSQQPNSSCKCVCKCPLVKSIQAAVNSSAEVIPLHMQELSSASPERSQTGLTPNPEMVVCKLSWRRV